MDLGLGGKVAWITGASSGLGLASARALAAEGVSVALSARRAEELEAGAKEIESTTGNHCIAVPLDVTDGPAIQAAARTVADELGPVDILIANAGGPPPGGFENLDEDALNRAFTLTTASAWRLAKTVVPSMKERGSGVILFFTSGSTKEIIPTLLLSNMMRAAVVGLAKTLAKELGPNGIRVLCVAPGRISTARLEQLDKDASVRTGKSVEDVRNALISTIPLGRYGDPNEFGSVVAFLASDKASFVSGVSVSVDGGQLNSLLA
jgi:3-oxoacyl-[acyl-carrier protein] reductase